MSAYSSSGVIRQARPRFPGTNANPTPQAPTQVTAYPDYDGMKRSLTYYQRGSKSQYIANFFSCKNFAISDMSTVLSIDQYDPVFCNKKDLIGDYTGESPSIHSSAQVTMIKIRSALNNLHFDRCTEEFFRELVDGITSAKNDKYIATIVEFLIHPVGFAKSPFVFQDTPRAKNGLTPLELENSGTISVKVQDKKSYLRHGIHMRWAVPVPSQWNSVGDWYLDKDIKGKITLYVEPIKTENESKRLKSVFGGFFGNDCNMVEDFLQQMINAGNRGIIPLHGLPIDFKHLISTIYLNTIKMDIESGSMELVNPYKYNSIISYYKNFIESNIVNYGTLVLTIEGFLNDFRNEGKGRLKMVLKNVHNKIMPAARQLSSQQLNTLFGDDEIMVDYKDKIDFDFHTKEDGYSEQDWEKLFETEGLSCLNWTKPLIFKRESDSRRTPVLDNNPMEFNNPLSYGMWGDYIYYDDKAAQTPGVLALDPISSRDAAKIRKEAAEDFFTIAAPLFNLTVPSKPENSTHISKADGYHRIHKDNPEYQSLVQDSTEKADRTIIEIARTLCSEIISPELCEKSRVGYDHQTHQNIAMTSDSLDRNHIFDPTTDIGRISKEISTAFPEFLDAISEYFIREDEKPKLKVIRGGLKGEKATVYMKQ